MANTLITPDLIAKEALIVLRNNAVMPNLVYRDFEKEFVAGVGDTVNVRKPATFEAKEFSSTVTVQDATESKVAIVMDKLLDVTFKVTSKERAMDIQDFSAQLLVPAMQAFADKMDSMLLAAGGAATGTVTATADPVADIIAARKILQANGAPLTERSYVMGTDTEADLLKTDLFISAEKVGDNGTALREASLGTKFGLANYVDQNIDSTAKKTGLVFHKNALALVQRPLEIPEGAASAAIQEFEGFGLRVVFAYDASTKTDTVSIDMLCGVKLLDDNLIAAINTTATP